MALGFSCVEIAVLVYVTVRDSYFDRANAIFHIPLVVQELLQAAVWLHVGENSETCDAANLGLSLMISIVVAGVPLWMSTYAHATQAALKISHKSCMSERLSQGLCPEGHRLESFETQVPNYYCSVCGVQGLPLHTRLMGCTRCGDFDACMACAENRLEPLAAATGAGNSPEIPVAHAPRTSLPAWARVILGRQPSLWARCVPPKMEQITNKQIFATAWMFLVYSIVAHLRIYGDGTFVSGQRCTTRGPNGHQIWPLLVWRPDQWWARLGSAIVYAVLGGGFIMVPKPSYTPCVLNALSFVTLALYAFVGNEWGSVWCWLASCMCVMYLVEPWLFRRFRVFDPEVFDGRFLDLRQHQRMGFWIARAHFLPEMLPRRDQRQIHHSQSQVSPMVPGWRPGMSQEAALAALMAST